MSKYVKNLLTEDLRERLKTVHDALLVNMVGLDANTNTRLRAELRAKNIHIMVRADTARIAISATTFFRVDDVESVIPASP